MGDGVPSGFTGSDGLPPGVIPVSESRNVQTGSSRTIIFDSSGTSLPMDVSQVFETNIGTGSPVQPAGGASAYGAPGAPGAMRARVVPGRRQMPAGPARSRRAKSGSRA